MPSDTNDWSDLSKGSYWKMDKTELKSEFSPFFFIIRHIKK